MAYIGVTASDATLRAAEPGEPLDQALRRGLAGAAPGSAVTILVHGYGFDPQSPPQDPHRLILAAAPDSRCWKVVSWPARLGLLAPGSGLGIGFGWRACEPHLPSLMRDRRTGFAAVYDRAASVGAQLATLIARIRSIAPDRDVDILAHSLGARVALAALPHLDVSPGRIVLLGAAEFDARVHEFLASIRAPSPPQIYNVTARANDLYDAVFETFAPRRCWGERAIGLGLRDGPSSWLDLQIDRPELGDWAEARGIALQPASARLCHWSFYTRAGAFDIYRAILGRRPGWDIATLRRERCFAGQEPRWSRFVPRGRILPRLDDALTLGEGLGNA